MDSETLHYDKCRTILMNNKKKHLRRCILITALMLCNALIYIVTLPILYNRVYLYGFFFGILALLYCASIVVLGFFAVQENPKRIILAGLLALLGTISGIIHVFFGILIILLFILQLRESKQALWVKEQPGYPYFNERFDEQMQYFGKAYQSDYTLDNPQDTVMQEMPDVPSPDFVLSESAGGAVPDEACLPGISGIDIPVKNQANAPDASQPEQPGESFLSGISGISGIDIPVKNQANAPDAAFPAVTANSAITAFPMEAKENSLQTDRILAVVKNPE